MFSIYNYSKDIMMHVKSDKYTGGKWTKIIDLVSIEDNLLVSSQISNSIIQIRQQEKMLQEQQAKLNSTAGATSTD